jgi:hypothetical protein
MSPDLYTDPRKVFQGTSETEFWGVDVTAELEDGDVLVAPRSALYDVTDGQPGLRIPLLEAPVLDGNLVLQLVPGASLTPGHLYRLDFTVQFNPSKVLTNSALIQCDY